MTNQNDFFDSFENQRTRIVKYSVLLLITIL